MGRARIDMHRLQEVIRLHRLGRSARAIARQLRIGRKTLNAYFEVLAKAGVLEGAPDDLPGLDALRAVVSEHVPSRTAPQQTSTVEVWKERNHVYGIDRRLRHLVPRRRTQGAHQAMTTITCKFTPVPKPAPGRTTRRKTASRRRTDSARVARMLALAYHIEERIEAGAIGDYSAAAAALGVTRARLSQVASLLLLAPEIQERILAGELTVSERDLRVAVARPTWSQQNETLAAMHKLRSGLGQLATALHGRL